ncbi:MAG TPA: condensation domain-containing protein, partial [Thermoanaerobaculia bacterium]|nr:condensation domain-containing protein [Thermoanaerobaculia bacterium]
MSDSPDKPINDRLSSLTPEQRALFEMLRKKKAAPKLDLKPPPVHRRAPAEHWPLSFDQERLWFLYAMDPRDTAYNIDTVTRLAGRLDVGALRQAYLEIARRHEIWRTRFPTVDGWPVQVIHEEVELDLGFADLLGLPEERRLPEAHRLLVEHARHPFVLEEGNLVRASMVRLAEEEHYFVLTVHHIVTDWVTFQIFWGELITLYEAFSGGRPSPLPELPVQYADFSVWQREWMQGEILETYRRYWTEKLAGAPLALDLPTDRPRPTVQSRTGDRARIFFDAARANGLKALARREGVTLFMTMLAIYQAVLSRHSGQDIVLVGTANANRNRPEIEPLLGFFLTQLVFCTDLGGDPTLRELLQRVREVALGAYKHQEMPFSKLVEALQPERDLSRHPVVQVILLVLDGHFGKFHSPGLDISAVDIHDETARYEQMIGVWDAPDSIYGWWEFQDVLFDPSTIARQLDSFHLLADALLENPDRRLSEVPVMTAEARHQALVAWNAAGALPVARGTLHGLVAARAAAAPDEIALVHRGKTLTRAGLAARSAAIARALRAAGVGPEARVAV